jgi:hypothetical protein
MNAAPTDSNAEGARHRGPSLLAVAIVFTSLFIGILVTTAAMTGGAHFPSPFDPAALATNFFSEHGRAVRLAAFLQFGAAIPLAIFTAVSVSRLRFLGVSAAGPTIALLGGVLASSMAALCGLVQWILAQPEIATSEGVMRGFHWLAFATGGPGFVVPFGILVAGVSVSGGLTRNLPRWVMWLGLVVAGLAELSSLTIATRAAVYLLPAARFPGLVWLIAAGATLPTRRRRERRSAGAPMATFEDAAQT